MAEKKITVWSEGGEDLTPEQEHKLEHKIDEMLSLGSAAPGSAPDAAAKAAVKSPKKAKKISIVNHDEHAAETPPSPEPAPEPATEPKVIPEPEVILRPVIDEKPEEVLGAPPLAKGTKAKVVPISDESELEPADDESPADEPEEAEESVPVIADDLDITQLSAAIDESVESTENPAKEKVPEQNAAPPKLAAPTSPAIPVQPSSEKRYRPPEGPIPFKRAEPDTAPVVATAPASPEAAAKNAPSTTFRSAVKPSRVLPSTRPVVAKQHRVRKTKRRGLLLVGIAIVALLCAAMVLPKTQAMILNQLNIGTTLSLTVRDDVTHQPVSGATVTIGSQTATTNADGTTGFSSVPLGSQTVTFTKAAYASQTQSATFAWHKPANLTTTMHATGTRYTLQVTDMVSGLPVPNATVTANNSETQSTSKGEVDLVLAKEASSKPLTVTAANYTKQQITLTAPTTSIKLLPSGNDVYVSRQGGTYNLYKSALDGTGQALLLAGTGHETASDLSVVTNASKNQTAFVATRDDQTDKAGNLLDALTIVSTTSGKYVTIDHGEQIKIIGWFHDTVVYSLLQPNTSTSDTGRYQLISYNTAKSKRTVLDQVNSLNDVLLIGNEVFYAAASTPSADTYVYTAAADGPTNKRTLLVANVAAILRVDWQNLSFATAGTWYGYSYGTGEKPRAGGIAVSASRLYIDDPFDSRYSVWANESGTQLLLHDMTANSDKVLVGGVSIGDAISWVSPDAITYRTGSDATAVDNVVSTRGGTSKQVTAVTDAAGLAVWRN